MRIGLIIDVERAVHELPMLDRIIDDLLGAGDEIVLLVPDHLPMEHRPGLDVIEDDAVLVYTTARSPWVRRPAMTRLADALQRATPDVFYAIGRDTWGVARDLQRRLQRPFAVSVWSDEMLRGLSRHRAESISAFVVPNEALGTALEERNIARELVSVVPYGVDIPETPKAIFDPPDTTIAVAILGPTIDVPAYRAVLEALAIILRDIPDLHVAMELRGNKAHDVWRVAKDLELLDHISTVGDAAAVRRLIIRCDVLVLPEADGTVTSLLLEAMASGLAIAALRDPHRTVLEEDVNATIVAGPEADSWESALRRLLTNPSQARELGKAARLTVATEHTRAEQAARLRSTFERMLSGDAIAFDPAR